MRLIDADAFKEAWKETSRYFDTKFDLESIPTIYIEDLRDASYYKEMYEKMCSINDNMFKSIQIYHKQHLADQTEIKTLKDKVAKLEGK